MSVMDVYWQAPPVTRTLITAVVLTSIAFHARLLSPYLFLFDTASILTTLPPQLWRLLTPFWVTGPKFSMLMDPVAMWQYSNALETDSSQFQRKGSFFVYIVFIKTIILLLSGVLLGNFIFMDPLLLAMAYTYSQDNPNRQQSFFVVTFSARYLPYVMLALTFVMTGASMDRVYNQATGLVAAHAYTFLTKIWPTFGGGTNWIEWMTPSSLRRAFGEGAPVARGVRPTGFGTVFSPSTANTSASAGQGGSTGRSSGFSPLSNWGGRGAGRRLGGG